MSQQEIISMLETHNVDYSLRGPFVNPVLYVGNIDTTNWILNDILNFLGL